MDRETAWEEFVHAMGGHDIEVLLTRDPDPFVRLGRGIVLQDKLNRMSNVEVAILLQDHLCAVLPSNPYETLVSEAIMRLGYPFEPES